MSPCELHFPGTLWGLPVLAWCALFSAGRYKTDKPVAKSAIKDKTKKQNTKHKTEAEGLLLN
jgi:hypothetical protein